jgi:glycosyltransferase involved in cell wall biosynthesis
MLAVVIPCYRVGRHILDVLARIDTTVERIYVVDDGCPERTGDIVEQGCRDRRVRVLRHRENRGVGAAVVTGYRAALDDGATIVVKLDGDGQMDPAQMSRLVSPVALGAADYAKGNRFYDLAYLSSMPRVRLLGNALLSLVNKISSGYWNVMDPTNGYTAIHRMALESLPLDRIDRGYFFESDMLFRLNTIRAVVRDVPLPARYGDESSSLRIGRVLLQFPRKYVAVTLKRIFYCYFLRDFNAGTLQLALGLLLAAFGTAFGVWHWVTSDLSGFPATSGTVMIAALPVLVGVQLLLGALQFDIQNVPKTPLSADFGASVGELRIPIEAEK